MSNKLEERSEILDRIHRVVQALTPYQALILLWCIEGRTPAEIVIKMDAIYTEAEIIKTIAEIRALTRQIDNGQLVFML